MDERLYNLTLTAFAYGGDAIGRIHDDAGGDRVVFVPFAMPGERVRVRLVEQRRGFARGELMEVIEPSPERIMPRCKHFGECGGCHYQYMPYELQLQAKTDILRDQFRRIGHIDDPPVQPTVPSPAAWNYRNQVQFHLTPEGKLAYIAADIPLRPGSGEGRHSDLPLRGLMPITECHLPEPALNALWPQLEFEPGMDIDRVSMREGVDEELMVVLESSASELPELEMEAGISVVHTFEEHVAVLAGNDHITMQVLGREFRVSAPSFFQVNTAMAEQMVKHVLGGLSSLNLPTHQSTVLDVYCGVGLFSAFLAPRCGRLIGIESSASACEDYAANLDELDNVELYEDAAENVLPTLDVHPDPFLVDPPRAGLMPAAVEAILRIQPAAVIYVSCDPSTLARDAARLLKGGYTLASVTPFDLFPQTYHIESISWFQR